MKERQHGTDLLAGYVVAPLEELFDIEHVDEAAGAGRDNDDGFLWMVNNTRYMRWLTLALTGLRATGTGFCELSALRLDMTS